MFQLSDYNYNLPEDRIAQSPVQPAHDSKLLFCKLNNSELKISDHHSYDLPDLLPPNTLLIANNSQVFAARIPLHNTKIILPSGEETILESGEIFIVRVLFDQANQMNQTRCIIRWSDKKHFKPWSTIFLNIPSSWRRKDLVAHKNIPHITSSHFVDDGIVINLHNITLSELCETYGDMPLPPYITNTSPENQQLYQTSFGQQQGSVATPTAGLHFTHELRNNLRKQWIKRNEITLHVGIGTFAPVVSEDIRDHTLHAETITIPRVLFEDIMIQKKQFWPVFTVGTTSTRSIESLPYLWTLLSSQDKQDHLTPQVIQRWDTLSPIIQKNHDFLLLISVNSDTITFSSSLFIYPGYQRTIIDGIITNFHLPQTSLVMLIAGLIGYENWEKSYYHALNDHYRFASFGDAMLIDFTIL